jgi:maltooligosyltrehalose synthase
LVNSQRHQLKELFLSGEYIPLVTNQGLNDSTQLFVYLRKYESQMCLVIVNMDVFHQAGPAIVHLPEDFDGMYQLYDVLSEIPFTRHGRELTVILEPGEGHLFSVKFTK